MRVTRIHVPAPLAEGAEVELPAQAGEHLTRVLRLEPGAALTLFNGAGGEYAAELGARSGKRVMARVLRHDPIERDSPLSITLLQGVARGERMDLIVQKSTELGISRIIPVLAERSIVKVDTRQRARKLEHWQAIAIAACEQCGRNRVPSIVEPLPLGDALGQLVPETARALLAADGASSLMAFATRAAGHPLALLIGPEGGLAANERQFALANGFEGCRLGPRILRTETAGIAALATLQAIAGDFSI
jgi:16S rRNA (uracil1498-N3)-methyltransferase